MFCKECGQSLGEESKFCSSCGTKVGVPNDVESSGVKANPIDTNQIEPNDTPAPDDEAQDSGEDIAAEDSLLSSDETEALSEGFADNDGAHLDVIDEDMPAPETLADEGSISETTAELDSKLSLEASEPAQLVDVAALMAQSAQAESSGKGGLIASVFVGLLLLGGGAYMGMPYIKNIIAGGEGASTAPDTESLAAEAAEKAKEAAFDAEAKAAYEEAKASGQIRKLGEFTEKYGDTPYSQEAEDLAYASLKRQNSKEALEAFQKWFPAKEASISTNLKPSVVDTSEDELEYGTWTGEHNASGAISGFGSVTFPSGDKFTGTVFADGAADGKMSYADDNVYTGQFAKNFVRQGRGVLALEGGDLYDGDFQDGAMQGKGIFSSPNGYRYEGGFFEGAKEGQGIEVSLDGTRYEGRFVDNEWDGEGVYVGGDGIVYVGSFVGGDFNGKGKVTYTSGNTYDGDWINDNRTGKGVYLFSSGERYEGDFIDNNRTGYGIMSFPDGSYYAGEFKDGDFHGQGSYTSETGTVIEGQFVDGLPQE